MRAHQRLFVNFEDVFEADEWELDTSDANNPVLELTVNGEEYVLPTSKDLLISGKNNKTEMELEGLMVYAPMTEQVFIPRQLVQYLK
jgi:hypothetical protein